MLYSRAIIVKLIVLWYVDGSDVQTVHCSLYSHTIQSLTLGVEKDSSVATCHRSSFCSASLFCCLFKCGHMCVVFFAIRFHLKMLMLSVDIFNIKFNHTNTYAVRNGYTTLRYMSICMCVQ